MTGGDPLAQLNPLRAPGPVDWWPPAPGWWILAATLLALLLLGTWLLWRAYRQREYRRQACRELALARQQWADHGDTRRYVQQVNRTLKAVAQRSFPRTDSAGLSGAAWRTFLNDTVSTPLFEDALDWAPYAPQAPEEVLAGELGERAEQWVRLHRGKQ